MRIIPSIVLSALFVVPAAFAGQSPAAAPTAAVHATAVASTNGSKASCRKEASARHLTGAALKNFVKECDKTAQH